MSQLALTLGLLCFESSAPAQAAQSRPSELQLAARSCPAVVVPRRAVIVAAPRDGVVESVSGAIGRVVKAGEVVAVLESRNLIIELEAVRVGLDEAAAQREKASILLTRAGEICRQHTERPEAFTEKERRDAEIDRLLAVEELRIAEVRIDRQRLEVRRLEDLVARSRVTAPFDGAVAVSHVEVGANVARGTALVRLISAGELIVRFAAPPEYSSRFGMGVTVEFEMLGSTEKRRVRVCRISPELDPDLQAVVVEAEILSSSSANSTTDSDMRAGAEGRVLID